ncbi:MAG: hypothetical protein MJZ19_10560 [Paludibacteraceae bacterium]|nr:hypothetical protein [Paludibacteraceae bacterium]
MGIFFSFKKPEIRQFNYIPRYYDAQKEEMKERRERIANELRKKQEGEVRRGDADGYSSGSSLKRGYLKNQRTASSGVNGGVWVKAIVISVVVGVVYYISKNVV